MPKPANSIVVFFGLIASGKSTLAASWAARHEMVYLNSDLIRKELAGTSAATGRKEALDQGMYSPEFSRRTYDALLTRAEQGWRAGQGVVLDGSYQRRHERDLVRKLATRLGVGVVFVLCSCPEAETMRRLAIRSRDVKAISDGRPEIYLAQKTRFEEPEELPDPLLVRLSTTGKINGLLDELDKIFEVRKHV